MFRRHRGSYRGRFAAQRATRRLTLALTCVLVLVVTGVAVGQRWVIYTDEGVRVQPPFLTPSEAVPPKVDVSVQVQAGVPVPTPSIQTVVRTRALWVTADALEQDGLDLLERAGADTVVLDMKGADGRLGYVSYQGLASAGNGNSDRVISVLARLRSEEVRTVACISCFWDGLLAPGGWLDPGDAAVTDYLSGVAAELARMGFDEILLEHWQVPGADAGDTEAFLRRVTLALEDTGAVLSLLGDAPSPVELTGRLWSETGEGAVQIRTQPFDPSGALHQAVRSAGTQTDKT